MNWTCEEGVRVAYGLGQEIKCDSIRWDGIACDEKIGLTASLLAMSGVWRWRFVWTGPGWSDYVIGGMLDKVLVLIW